MTEIPLKKILHNVFYVLGAQIIILLISVIRSLLLPAFFSVESYGYWQVYLFYSAYVGIFAFGFNDGIYLRYGDFEYSSLPFNKLRTSIRIFSLMLLFISIVTIFLVTIFCKDSNLRYAFIFSAFNILILGISGVFTYILQITNQLKKYSFFSVADKILVIITVVLMFFVNNNNYKIIIAVDFTAKTLVLLIMIYLCKELWVGENSDLKSAYNEFKKNINVGIKLLIANLMGMLVIGLGRFFIQFFGRIEDFATYSFAITVTGLILTTITAFSLVLYPTLKRLNENNYGKYFNNINSVVIVFNLFALLLYFPAYLGVEIFYIKYKDLLPYLNLLFVVTILQSKMSILNNTFYKVLRKEKEMLIANGSSIIVFLIIAPIMFYFTKTIWSIAFSTALTMIFRCYASEIFLRKELKMGVDKIFTSEITGLLIFSILTTINLYISILIYILFLVFWFVYNRNRIRDIIKIFAN